ncbi:MAG: glycosyltransferase, partial [Gemmatimonadota bacterium]
SEQTSGPPDAEEREQLERLVKDIVGAQGNHFVKELLRERGIRIGTTKAEFERNLLEVIGDGPLAEPLRALATELGVADRVTWPGFLDRAEILRRMRRADMFVLSSLHEGLGIVVQEAMFAGLPIVATDNGGQTDLVTDGENGLVVPAGDPGAIAEAVGELMGDDERRATMGRRSRERIAKLSMPDNAEQVLNVLRRAIAASSRYEAAVETT